MKNVLGLLLATALAATPVSADSIKWPKDSFTVEQLKDAEALAAKEKKPIAYIIMERGGEDDDGDASEANSIAEDLAKDCARFAVVVNVRPADLQKEPIPFNEKVYGAFAGALEEGTIPALVIADAAGQKIYAYSGSKEIIEDSSKLLREAKRNIKEGKETAYKAVKKEDEDEDEDEE